MVFMSKNQNQTWLVLLVVVLGCFSSGCRSGLNQVSDKNVSQLVKQLAPQGKMAEYQFDPEKEAMVCVETAIAVGKAGHLKEAIRLYEKALTHTPDESEILLQLAPLYAQSGRSDRAIGIYQKLIETEEGNQECLNNYAWTLMESGRLRSAKTLVSNGLTNFPDSEKLITTLAVINYKQGYRTTAFDLFSEVLGQHAAHHNLAILDIDSKDRINAKFHVDKAMQINPNPLTVQLSNAINEMAE